MKRANWVNGVVRLKHRPMHRRAKGLFPVRAHTQVVYGRQLMFLSHPTSALSLFLSLTKINFLIKFKKERPWSQRQNVGKGNALEIRTFLFTLIPFALFMVSMALEDNPRPTAAENTSSSNIQEAFSLREPLPISSRISYAPTHQASKMASTTSDPHSFKVLLLPTFHHGEVKRAVAALTRMFTCAGLQSQ